MRAWISIAALTVAVAALGFWVYSRPTAPGAHPHRISALEPAQVRQIRLERPAAAFAAAAPVAVVLERKDDAWRMTEPFAARADAFQVGRLLAILDARSSSRYPATDLARYGLDTPQAVLTLNDQTIGYGAVNSMTREQYVLTRDAVYAIPLAQRMALPRDANALLARGLLAPNEVPARFELPAFTATLDDGTWSIAPSPSDAGADERNAWVDAWRNATAVQAVRHDERAATPQVKIGLKDGRTVPLAILQREPELVLLRLDEGVAYHFFADAGRRLLTLPAGPSERVNK